VVAPCRVLRDNFQSESLSFFLKQLNATFGQSQVLSRFDRLAQFNLSLNDKLGVKDFDIYLKYQNICQNQQ
jgi:hypothetical protein